MNDENELNLDELDLIETSADNKLKVKNRFEKLSEKVILTAKEKDQAESRAKTQEEARLKAEKERDFYKDFSQLSSKHPSANQFQEQILEKVNSGLSTEDATLLVLAKEGKLGGNSEQPRQQVAGGSASNAITDTDKEVSDMTQDERRNALIQAEKEGANLLKFGSN